MRQIVMNCGTEGAVVVEKIRDHQDPKFGFNASTEQYEDLVKAVRSRLLPSLRLRRPSAHHRPQLEIGDTIALEEGLVGVVLARYTLSGDARSDVHYIVELRREAEEH